MARKLPNETVTGTINSTWDGLTGGMRFSVRLDDHVDEGGFNYFSGSLPKKYHGRVEKGDRVRFTATLHPTSGSASVYKVRDLEVIGREDDR